jgi:hypothetical protein
MLRLHVEQAIMPKTIVILRAGDGAMRFRCLIVRCPLQRMVDGGRTRDRVPVISCPTATLCIRFGGWSLVGDANSRRSGMIKTLSRDRTSYRRVGVGPTPGDR